MDSDEELFPIVNDLYSGSDVFQYNDPFLVSGILRAVVSEELERVRELIKVGHSVNINDNNGNTPLHVAVIKKNLTIIKFLLDQEDTFINARNFLGQTPLFIAARNGSFELAECLINKGANVNLPNYEEVTPLHVSVEFPNVAHLLVKNGANVDASDYSDDTPLHDAIDHHLETVCMLLYHNADANRIGGNNLTPFMKALIVENLDLQEALFEYVDDFNISTCDGISTLALALNHENPFVEEIINRGAKVDILAYKMCLKMPNPVNFKLVWKKLPCEQVKYVSLLELAYLLDDDHETHFFQEYMDIIIEESDDAVLGVLAENLQSRDLALLVDKYAHCNLSLDKLTKLTCLLLQYGFQMSSFVIYEVFANFGYCELFKILLFMDYISEWTPFMITARLIFDIQTNMNRRCSEIASVGDVWIDVRQLREDAKKSFDYWIYRPLIDVCQNQFHDEYMFDLENDGFSEIIECLPTIPSLLELARNKTREHIIEKLKMSTTCQYYTFVNHMNISLVYKKILMFEKKIYRRDASGLYL